jgi:hypothetical protein
MIFRLITIAALTALTGLIVTGAVTVAQEPPKPDQLVDALNGAFGKHPGARAAPLRRQLTHRRFPKHPNSPSPSALSPVFPWVAGTRKHPTAPRVCVGSPYASILVRVLIATS